MEIKLEPNQSHSNNQLVKSNLLKAKSSLLPQSNEQISKKNTYFQNGYANQKFFNRYARSQYILGGIVTINMLIMIIYFQMGMQNHWIKQWLLYIGIVPQFLSIFALIINYITYNEYKMHANHHHQLKKPIQIIFYSFLLLIQPYPFLQNYTLSFYNQLYLQSHKVNDLLCLCSLTQVCLIIPSFFISSKYQSLRSQRLSQMYGFKSSYIYALKCWFKQNSTGAIGLVFLMWFMLCAIGIRMAEYESNPILKSFENSMWFTFITMSTVGFGDLKSITNIGYIVNTIILYSGVIISSIAVMLLRNIFELNTRQKRTLIILKSLQQKNQLKIIASKYIRQALWRIWRNRKNKQYGIKQNPSLNQRNLRQQFKILRRQSQNLNYQTNIKDEFKNNFAKIFGYIDNLKQNQQRMIQYFHFKR